MSVDPELRITIARGEYSVDAHAVAQAIIDRVAGPSGVFVPAQLDRLVALAEEDDPTSGGDAA